MEELKEIKGDFKWANSKDGKLIIKIEHWVEAIRIKLQQQFNNNEILVGRNLIDNPKELIIGGIVNNESELNSVKSFIESEKPPVLPIYKFEVI